MINKALNALMQSEIIGKVLQHEALVEAILRAVTSSLEAKDVLSAHYEQLLTQVGLVTTRQLDELNAELDLFRQEAEGLREQLDVAAQTTRKLRQRAEQAERELAETHEEVKRLRAELKTHQEAARSSSQGKDIGALSDESKSEPSVSEQPEWRPSMTKAELIDIASELGLSLSAKLKKSELIERLRALSDL